MCHVSVSQGERNNKKYKKSLSYPKIDKTNIRVCCLYGLIVDRSTKVMLPSQPYIPRAKMAHIVYRPASDTALVILPFLNHM